RRVAGPETDNAQGTNKSVEISATKGHRPKPTPLQMKPAAAKFVTTASRKLGGLCATNNAKPDGASTRDLT
ncbi:MAG: hypothetical protein WBW37_06155, partial [Methyloceanibacter sp.]